MIFNAKWIGTSENIGDVCPVFQKNWIVNKEIRETKLYLTALGVYEAKLNGKRISDYVLAPGWTAYDKRLQYQEYDITDMVNQENTLEVTVGKGWFSSPMPGWMDSEDKERREARPRGIYGEIHIMYGDGSSDILITDESWKWSESAVLFSEIYDGESYDASYDTTHWKNVTELKWSTDILIPQEGEVIKEMERVAAKAVFTTSAGELLIDFGQEVTGYVEFTVDAHTGDIVHILHGEVLDKDGNFYNENYRSAKAELHYVCKEGKQTYHPHLTFYGFRYIKLEQFPGWPTPEQFTAIVVHSDIKKTGRLVSGSNKINQLIANIFWGQKGNFLDVPTDCPQRDERLGWTGDAQVFIKAASYNYDVEQFFRKWLRDLSADQRENGAVGQVIPDYMPEGEPSAAWGDAAVICPWQIYLTYGNKKVLEEQFDSMKKWVDYITAATTTRYLWTDGVHFGDWLGLDAPSGSYKGSTREAFIASAFYAYSTSLLIKAGRLITRDVSKYEQLYENIVSTFRKVFPIYQTQTEYVLAIWFGLAKDPQKTADELAAVIVQDGNKMQTGFVGTPYILHVLSKYGYSDLAYTLLLREKYPSWLYSVRQGATTIWEHWDGIMENGEFWSADMNSFNHYAYGSVADWIYEVAAGIQTVEEAPGFEKVVIAPMPDERLGYLEASIDTRHGVVSSSWKYIGSKVRYDIIVEMSADIVIDGKTISVGPGQYVFWN